jgi:hypothetical protein
MTADSENAHPAAPAGGPARWGRSLRGLWRHILVYYLTNEFCDFADIRRRLGI